MKVIDQNNIFRKYDFSSVISKDDNIQTCDVVRNIIANGDYFTNSPKYQTKENLFARPEPIWLKYRMSFLFSVFMYLGREVKVSNMMASQNPNAKMMSGVWYLHIPEDVKDRDYAGTEMAPFGISHDEKYFVRPTESNWLIYPSDKWHRPGIVQSNKYRFILAADIEYID